MSILDMISFISQSSRKTPKTQQYGPSTVVYWSRFALGVVAGLLCYLLQLKGSIGITVAALLYLLSITVVRRRYYDRPELQTGHKAVMLGVGTYVFTWAALWIFLYTLNPY
jgi:hypothetical protein